MRSFDKVIVTCAVTGAIHVPTMSPYLPIEPEEIAEEAIAAAEAGASIIHLHVRDPETGEPVTDLELFRDVAGRIHDACDVIIQPTTGGAPTMKPEERIRVVPELEPEMASCNMGSINFGLYPILEKYDEFEHDWEREYLEGSRDLIFHNTFEDLDTILPIFNEHGTKPELECYDVGHLYNVKHYVERGLLETPLHFQFVMGIHGGIGPDVENLTHMVHIADKLFGDEYSFSVLGAGRHEFPRAIQAVEMGGHARVGLEDNLYLESGKLAKSNADLVEKVVRLTHDLTGREIATTSETREFFGLKGRKRTNIRG
ncbi:3-keto-5-aminohexanoate cleavage protein [Natrarchaeobius halalkaliphilus]|uniref:3-keto-5-aminohexanoate cleavage protein n=1 Tax=Natrarchaeobius halalkaliphilus TaxID=1679091 RepID=A0A3N6LNT2_9EURY|nr:3-keto-5-aminohexanoate cleavage protein [Natrarchaeobius halalkaliphilus]RQG87847.1 3-keto-5-aminohexanoate cleavage protein [Natrarchaeobius halalkaliphilus]